MYTCECGRNNADRAETCLLCGGPNKHHPARLWRIIRASISGAIWGILIVAVLFFIRAYFQGLARADTIMQQIYTAADILVWVVSCYIVTKAITSILK
jgi:hypothetical protein